MLRVMKMTGLLMCLVLGLSLCACGNAASDVTDEVQAQQKPEGTRNETKANVQSVAETAPEMAEETIPPEEESSPKPIEDELATEESEETEVEDAAFESVSKDDERVYFVNKEPDATIKDFSDFQELELPLKDSDGREIFWYKAINKNMILMLDWDDENFSQRLYSYSFAKKQLKELLVLEAPYYLNAALPVDNERVVLEIKKVGIANDNFQKIELLNLKSKEIVDIRWPMAEEIYAGDTALLHIVSDIDIARDRSSGEWYIPSYMDQIYMWKGSGNLKRLVVAKGKDWLIETNNASCRRFLSNGFDLAVFPIVENLDNYILKSNKLYLLPKSFCQLADAGIGNDSSLFLVTGKKSSKGLKINDVKIYRKK